MLTPQTLVDNQTAMQRPWDPNTPFETLINQIEDSMEVADAASQAYTKAQVLTISYTLVYNTGLYFDECKTWNAKAVADKTWDKLKTFFLHAQSELRLQQQATSARTGFSNFVNEQENQENATANALTNLATAQAADRQAFCQIDTTNSELAEQLRTALKGIASLKDLVNNRPPPCQQKQNNSYCWTHGFCVAAEHNSTNCKNQGSGHQTSATKDNIMGGSTAPRYSRFGTEPRNVFPHNTVFELPGSSSSSGCCRNSSGRGLYCTYPKSVPITEGNVSGLLGSSLEYPFVTAPSLSLSSSSSSSIPRER
jgi:hypothetical protein